MKIAVTGEKKFIMLQMWDSPKYLSILKLPPHPQNCSLLSWQIAFEKLALLDLMMESSGPLPDWVVEQIPFE